MGICTDIATWLQRKLAAQDVTSGPPQIGGIRAAGVLLWMYLVLLSDFRCSQDLTQTAWALAKFGSNDQKLLGQIAKQAQAKIGEFLPPQLAELGWAYSKLGCLHGELLGVLSSQVACRLPGHQMQD